MKLGAGGRQIGGRRNRRDDDQQAVFVAGRDAFVFDRHRQRNSLHELAVNDLFLQKGTVKKAHRLATASRDDEKSLVEADPQAFGIGAGNLNDDDDAPCLLVDEYIGVRHKRPETSPNDEFHQPYNPRF
jgi:hypothetical protein